MKPAKLICSRSEEHTSELQAPCNLVCRLLLEKKKRNLVHRWVTKRTTSGGIDSSVCSFRARFGVRIDCRLRAAIVAVCLTVEQKRTVPSLLRHRVLSHQCRIPGGIRRTRRVLSRAVPSVRCTGASSSLD